MVERRTTMGVLAHAVMILGMLIVAFPLYLAFVASTHTSQDIVQLPMPLLLLTVTVIASCATQLALVRLRIGPAEFLDQATRLAAGGYFSMTGEIGTLTFGTP